MRDLEKEYDEKYGDIPDSKGERINILLQQAYGKRGFRIDLKAEISRIRRIRWIPLNFVIHLEPKGTPRPRQGRGNHFYVKGAADNKRFFKKFYKQWSTHPKIVTACKMTTISYLPITQNMKKYEMVLAELGLIRPIVNPDFDNLIKTYADMIQGTLLYNDNLIVEGTSKKYYSMKPRIEIFLEYQEEYDSVFNKKKMEGKDVEMV